jgi:hypothetical protein
MCIEHCCCAILCLVKVERGAKKAEEKKIYRSIGKKK